MLSSWVKIIILDQILKDKIDGDYLIDLKPCFVVTQAGSRTRIHIRAYLIHVKSCFVVTQAGSRIRIHIRAYLIHVKPCFVVTQAGSRTRIHSFSTR